MITKILSGELNIVMEEFSLVPHEPENGGPSYNFNYAPPAQFRIRASFLRFGPQYSLHPLPGSRRKKKISSLLLLLTPLK